ncbi:MFS transporter [Candidatus Megaera polyxenophila]|uniref:MFS transporter n=1 Tax=Candidatus Megaera polyxenophila TaxID=988779 RepID=UPI003977E08A
MLSMINGTITLSIATAPIIGSYINLFFQWRGNFIALLVLSVICLILSLLFIPKTSSSHVYSSTSSKYLDILKSKKSMLLYFNYMFFNSTILGIHRDCTYHLY